MADITLFATLFVTLSYYWYQQADLFRASQARLHPLIGMANTIVLVTSSWFVAKGTQAARRGLVSISRALLCSAILCGIAFAVIKVFEYRAEVATGALLTTNDFFMFYYVMSGVHLLHVVVGIIALIFLFNRLPVICANAAGIPMLEAGAAYWHMVDLLWIFLFPLLYLLH